jgi:hypothetical protein
VARDQVPVLGGHQIRLDVVGPEFDAQRIRLQRVLGQVAAAATAVADHQGRRFVVARTAIVRLDPRAAEQQAAEQRTAGHAAQHRRELHELVSFDLPGSCGERVTSP